MKKFVQKKLGLKFKTVTGILVIAPPTLREDDIDLLLIGEDGVEYQLKGNRKTFKMWNLVDTRVQIMGIVVNKTEETCTIKTITYKCIDDFMDTDFLPVNQFDYFDFDVSRFDYAI